MSFAELESQETVDLTEAEGTLNLKTSFELRRKPQQAVALPIMQLISPSILAD